MTENEFLLLSILRSEEDAERIFALASAMLTDYLSRPGSRRETRPENRRKDP
jgi:hypothetical protein